MCALQLTFQTSMTFAFIALGIYFGEALTIYFLSLKLVLLSSSRHL